MEPAERILSYLPPAARKEIEMKSLQNKKTHRSKQICIRKRYIKHNSVDKKKKKKKKIILPMIPRMNLRSTAIIFLLPTTTVSKLVILQEYLQQTHKGKQQTNCAANTSYRFYIVLFYTLSFLSFLFSFYVALSSSSLEFFVCLFFFF